MASLIHAFGLDWKLLITQVINFGLVLFVLWYFLYKPTMAMIDTRQKKIARGVEDADKAREERKNADKEKKQILSKANIEAVRIVADGKREKISCHFAKSRTSKTFTKHRA
jgi:F-type H+-transporting ATPase subunit b